MTRIMLIYGGIAGTIVIAAMVIGYQVSDGEGFGSSQLIGYLFMLIALSMIFIGIKRYRDQEQGGVIKFSKAFLMGLGISAVAGIAYVISWEVYLAMTGDAFIESYTANYIEMKKAAGVTGAELEKVIATMEETKKNYANRLYRMPITFMEIFPVGLLISLISALILRNSKVLPAHS